MTIGCPGRVARKCAKSAAFVAIVPRAALSDGRVLFPWCAMVAPSLEASTHNMHARYDLTMHLGPRKRFFACLSPEADCPAVATLFCQILGEILPAPSAMIQSVNKHERS